MDDKLKITLKIAGLDLKTRINRDDEEVTRLAAKEINRIFDVFSNSLDNRELVLIYTALHFAVSFLKEKNADFLGTLAGDLSELNASLQEFIETNINS